MWIFAALGSSFHARTIHCVAAIESSHTKDAACEADQDDLYQLFAYERESLRAYRRCG